MKSILRTCLALFAATNMANAKSPAECTRELGEKIFAEEWTKCIQDDSNLAKNPEPEGFRSSPGYVRGVKVGDDSVDSIHKRRPDILGSICPVVPTTPIATKYDVENCKDSSYFNIERIVLEGKGFHITMDQDVIVNPAVDLKVFRFQHTSDGIEMYFHRDKLFMVYMLDKFGKPVLETDIEIALLKEALGRKHAKGQPWSFSTGQELTKATVWYLDGNIHLELLEKFSIYRNQKEVIDTLQILAYLPETEEVLTKKYSLQKIANKGKFPAQLAYQNQLRYLDIQVLNSLMNPVRTAEQASKKNETVLKRAVELEKINRLIK